jgi:hypothetical protein
MPVVCTLALRWSVSRLLVHEEPLRGQSYPLNGRLPVRKLDDPARRQGGFARGSETPKSSACRRFANPRGFINSELDRVDEYVYPPVVHVPKLAREGPARQGRQAYVGRVGDTSLAQQTYQDEMDNKASPGGSESHSVEARLSEKRELYVINKWYSSEGQPNG